MTLEISRGTGRYRPGEADVVLRSGDRDPDPELPAILYCHEHGAGAGAVLGEYLLDHFGVFCDAGFVGMGADLGGPATWGSDDAIEAVTQAWQFLVDEFGVRADRLHLYGGSMGTLTSLNWALENAGCVGAVGLLVPMFDLERFYRDDPIALRWEIDEAYDGPAGFHTKAKRRSPLACAPELAGTPIRIWYSEDDPLAPPEDVAPFVERVGPSASSRSLGAHGHAPIGLSGSEVAEFFLAHSRREPALGRA